MAGVHGGEEQGPGKHAMMLRIPEAEAGQLMVKSLLCHLGYKTLSKSFGLSVLHQ